MLCILYFTFSRILLQHYDDVIMAAIASQITNLTIVYSTVYSGADQSKHQSSASLDFVWGIHQWPVNSPHKWPVTRKMFPFDDVIMYPCVLSLNQVTATHLKNGHLRFNLYSLWNMRSIYISVPKLQRCNRCSLESTSNFTPHLILCLWLLIHSGIKVNPC